MRQFADAAIRLIAQTRNRTKAMPSNNFRIVFGLATRTLQLKPIEENKTETICVSVAHVL